MKMKRILILISAMCLFSGNAWAAFSDVTPLICNKYIFVDVANSNGSKYNFDADILGGPDDTYFMKFDGGGLNESHITTSSATADVRGQVTTRETKSSSASGTFYVTNTGGRGYDDDIILLLSVSKAISNDFSVKIKSSGYTWDPPTVNGTGVSGYTHTGGMEETFTKDDFRYGPHQYKPGPGGNGETPSWTLPLYQPLNDPTGTPEESYLMFIDLYAGNLSTTWYQDVTTDNGALRVDFELSGLTSGSTAAFNVYGWCLSSNQGEGISWTNRPTGSEASGYSVTYTGAAPVPIPAAFWLLGSGFSGLFFLKRRKSISC
jgi:hypothetical protein